MEASRNCLNSFLMLSISILLSENETGVFIAFVFLSNFLFFLALCRKSRLLVISVSFFLFFWKFWHGRKEIVTSSIFASFSCLVIRLWFMTICLRFHVVPDPQIQYLIWIRFFLMQVQFWGIIDGVMFAFPAAPWQDFLLTFSPALSTSAVDGILIICIWLGGNRWLFHFPWYSSSNFSLKKFESSQTLSASEGLKNVWKSNNFELLRILNF